jgi:hypothetical protein
MKDNRFIELLNLYIDRQITAEETAELESEIQNSPQRQAVSTPRPNRSMPVSGPARPISPSNPATPESSSFLRAVAAGPTGSTMPAG